MTKLIKPVIPYVTLVGLLVLTLCTREQQSTAEDLESMETVDSVAMQNDSQMEDVISKANKSNTSSDNKVEDI